MGRFRWLSVAILLLGTSCGKDLPTLDGIDTARWKDDPNACKNIRASMRPALEKEMKKLLALKELQVVKLFGRPDRNELYKRNQKFYYYFLEPAEACASGNDHPARLVVRFNAMGLAKEVLIE